MQNPTHEDGDLDVTQHRELADPDQLKALLDEHGSDHAVADVLGTSHNNVGKWRRKHGIPTAAAAGRQAPTKPELADPNRLAALIDTHRSDAAVAEALGVASTTVGYWRRKHGIEAAGPGHPVLADPSQLAALLAARGTAVAAADALGVSNATVSRWRRRHAEAATDDPETLKAIVDGAGSDRKAATVLRISPTSVRNLRLDLDVPPAGQQTTADPNLADPDRLAELVEQHGPDRAIAEVVGVAEGTVRRWRNEHGIDPSLPMTKAPDDLRDEDTLRQLVAEHRTDRAVAEAVGTKRETVLWWRQKYGIAPGTATPKELEDADTLRDLVGKFRSDKAVAEQLDVAPTTVASWRHRHGIEAANPTGPKLLHELRDPDTLRQLLEEHGTTVAVADHLDVGADTVRRWRKRHGIRRIPQPPKPSHPALADPDQLTALVHIHGTDSAVADELDVSASTVGEWRRKHGIDPARRPSKEPHPSLAEPVLLDELIDLHGSDQAIADALGVSSRTVLRWRTRHGLTAGPSRSEPDRYEVLDLQDRYGTDEAIANALGVTAPQVAKWRHKFGIDPTRLPTAPDASPADRNPTPDPELTAAADRALRRAVDRAIVLYGQDIPLDEAAEQVGLTADVVRTETVRRYGLDWWHSWQTQHRGGNRIPDGLITEAADLVERGWSVAEAARHVGISPKTATNRLKARHGRAWWNNHVTNRGRTTDPTDDEETP